MPGIEIEPPGTCRPQYPMRWRGLVRALLPVSYGRAFTDVSMRVYDAARLWDLLAPLSILQREYAWSPQGVWMPCSQNEAASVDWRGPTRAVGLIVARTPGAPEGTG